MLNRNSGRKKPYLPVATQQEVREHFTYQPEYGLLYWAKSTGARSAGEVAGGRTDFYHAVTFNRVLYDLRKLVWIYHYGAVPAGGIKSIDGKKFNSRIENLTPRKKPKVSFL